MMRHPSLQRHLLAWALAALLVVWGIFVAMGYQTGMHEADELTDGHLASVASVLLLAHEMASPLPAAPPAPRGRPELKAHDYQQSLSVITWDGNGKILARSGEAPAPAFSDSEGFETFWAGQPREAWRAFSRWDGRHEKRVTVMLSMQERDDLAKDIAEQVAWPGLWLLPVVALVLTLAIRRGLRPLGELTRQVHLLDIHKDRGLQAPPHEEFREVVQSINLLIARYNTALERERALASEVAHELRTPLASLTLHAALLRGTLTPQERDDALGRVEQDAARASSVLSFLLALARASRAELAEAVQPVDLVELARSVTGSYGQDALDSGHELSLDAQEPCTVNGHPVLLEMALRNLIDNALAHTPRGTSVQVRVSCGPAAIEVRDNGLALAREVPLTHKPGLGLGHQVVRRIAAVHGGTFEAVKGEDSDLTCWRITLGQG